MRLRSTCIPALVIVVLLFAATSAYGQAKAPAGPQAKPPTRTAQRDPAPKDVQPANATTRVPAVSPPAQADPRAGQPNGRNAPPAGAANPQPKVITAQAPFTLTPAQEKLLDQILRKWEMESAKVERFKCAFDRWEIDKTFGPAQNKFIKSEASGVIKYVSPDRGNYYLDGIDEWNPQKKKMEKKTEGLEHWMCDGKAIYEFNSAKKQLIVRNLPPDMQGKAITDGPLPFIFGAKADQLKKRYWMRDITPPDQISRQVWLEAWPKRQQDAANFHHATLILTDPGFQPFALQIFLPDGKNSSEYAFRDSKVNDPLSIVKGDFLPPITPLTWTKVVDPENAEAAGGALPAAAKNPPPAKTESDQARRPAATTKRK